MMSRKICWKFRTLLQFDKIKLSIDITNEIFPGITQQNFAFCEKMASSCWWQKAFHSRSFILHWMSLTLYISPSPRLLTDEDDATTSGHNIEESEKRVIFINQTQPQKYCNNHISTAKYRWVSKGRNVRESKLLMRCVVKFEKDQKMWWN